METEVIFMMFDTFIAANTAKGFFSYFDELIHDKTLNRIYLIKGGPGSGKSTLMKKIASTFNDMGCTVERIFCSSDVSSLDGVKIYDKGIVIIDATSPHSYDMSRPGTIESLVDLSKFWNEDILTQNKEEIDSLFREISDDYKHIYGMLKAAGDIQLWKNKLIEPHIDNDRIGIFIKKIIKQNGIIPIDSEAKTSNRMLTAFSGESVYTLSDTVNKLCDNIISLNDSADIAHNILLKTHLYFNKLGYDTLLIHSPLLPDCMLEQIIIPQVRLGFIASNHIYSPNIDNLKISKSVNTKIFINEGGYSQNKNKINFAKKLCAELISQCTKDLSEIKAKHDALEEYYISAMNYKELNRYTSEFIKKINNK